MIWSTPLITPIAPDQAEELGTSTVGPMPLTLNRYRQPVEPVLEVHHRTVSAGTEIAAIPQAFEQPDQIRFRSIYQRLTAGFRTTILAPELQADIAAGSDTVMKTKGMTPPYTVRDPGPWYESFARTI